jgi:hypothetical protein
MPTPRAGRNAAIYIDTSSAANGSAVPVSLKNNWSLDQATERFETTAFGDTNKSYVSGMPDVQGSFAGMWDADDTNLYNLIGSSSARKMYLYPDRLNNAAIYFFTTAFFDLSFEAPVDGLVSVNGNFGAASVATWKTS